MKKVLSLVLTLALVLSFGLTALASTEIDVSGDNLGRGSAMVAYGTTIKANDDGTVTAIETELISFYLPEDEPVLAGETVTVNVKGSSDGDFRMWLIDVNETTNSEIYQMSEQGFTSGDFDKTFTLTATGDSTEFAIKAFAWGEKLDNLTVDSLTITKGGEAAPAEDVADDVADDVVADASPQTGETSYAILLVGLMIITLGGALVLRKKSVRE